jgi:hypothetical protein
MGTLLVAVLMTPMNRRPILFISKAAQTDAKYESAQTMRSVLLQGNTTYCNTFVLHVEGHFGGWTSSAVLKSFNRIITLVATVLWLPVNCNVHWKTHVDPVIPCPYQRAIDSSTQILSDG